MLSHLVASSYPKKLHFVRLVLFCILDLSSVLFCEIVTTQRQKERVREWPFSLECNSTVQGMTLLYNITQAIIIPL